MVKNDENKSKKDLRPEYVPPLAMRLDDVHTGIGNCHSPGSGPAGGKCDPTGAYATRHCRPNGISGR